MCVCIIRERVGERLVLHIPMQAIMGCDGLEQCLFRGSLT